MAFKAAPLPASFTVTSMFGFIISAVSTASGRLSPSWGFAFCLVFVLMFIASFISLEKAPVEAELKVNNLE